MVRSQVGIVRPNAAITLLLFWVLIISSSVFLIPTLAFVLSVISKVASKNIDLEVVLYSGWSNTNLRPLNTLGANWKISSLKESSLR